MSGASIRIAREYALQIASFATIMADRLLLAGLLLRYWGVDDFALWSLVAAAAGLIMTFDFGINLFYSNRVAMLVHQGDSERAKLALTHGNLAMFMASAVGFVSVLIGFAVYEHATESITLDLPLWTILGALLLHSFVKMATTVQMATYRAHDEFARATMINAGIDAARIFAIVVIVVMGGGDGSCCDWPDDCGDGWLRTGMPLGHASALSRFSLLIRGYSV